MILQNLAASSVVSSCLAVGLRGETRPVSPSLYCTLKYDIAKLTPSEGSGHIFLFDVRSI